MHKKRKARVIDALDEGDVLLVTRLDRLARSTRDLLNALPQVAEKKAGFRSLGDSWADSTTAHGRLMLTVLAGLAEFERELIRARTGEGRARAKARGVKLGPHFKLTPHQRKEALGRPRQGRNPHGHRPHLQRQPQHHFEAFRMNATVLYGIDSAKRMHRFYRLDVQPDLFGHWCLMREGGRIGSTGQTRSLPFPTPQEAESALQRQRSAKERRGHAHRVYFIPSLHFKSMASNADSGSVRGPLITAAGLLIAALIGGGATISALLPPDT